MIIYFFVLVAGFFGGVVRGLVGFLKHQLSYKNVPFDLKYFLGTSFISGIIGLMAAMSIKEVGLTLEGSFSPALSFIIGYAGGDFLESIYRLIISKSNLPQDKAKE